MAIKKLTFTGNELINGGTISFKNNIISVVGMNGSGKTILMNHIKRDFNKKWIKQVVHKADIEEIESQLREIYNRGKSKEAFNKLIQKIKDDEMMSPGAILDQLDEFIWKRFKMSVKNILLENFDEGDYKRIWKSITSFEKENFFDAERLVEEIPELENITRFDLFTQSSLKTQQIMDQKFNNSKVITVDIQNNEPGLSGQVQQNGLGKYSLSATLKDQDNQFFVRLLRVAGITTNINEIILNQKQLSPSHISKINNWFSSYISQDIKISISLNDRYYEILFLEKKNVVPFSALSLGTKNLIKIISQIENLNSETIVQIDEPETGMHPVMQIQFREFLENVTNLTNARFIIYTHSTYIVKDGESTRGLYIMVRKNAMSNLYTVDEYTQLEDIMDFQIYENIGYINTKKNYGLNPNKKVIVVEGETDVIYLKKMSKLLKQDYQITRVKFGGASNINKTLLILEVIFDFEPRNIIVSLDLNKKDSPEHKKMLKDNIKSKIEFLGTNTRPEIEGLFSIKDKKYISQKTANKNTKTNKANYFWRTVSSLNNLSEETINNFKNYFKKIK